MPPHVNQRDDIYTSHPSSTTLSGISDRLIRLQFLGLPPALQADARERLQDSAQRYPRSAAARAWRLGLYAPGQAGEAERLREGTSWA